MASFNFTNLARHLANGAIKFDGSQTYKVLLLSALPSTTDTTGNQDVWVNRSDVTGEIAATGGYTAGGIAQAFTLNALTLVGGKQTVTWTDQPSAWTSATITAVGSIIYLNSGAAATDKLLHCIDFGGTITSTAGTFALAYSTTLQIVI